MTEFWAGIVSLIGGIAIISIFTAIAVGARRHEPEAHDAVYRVRRYYAMGLVAVLVLAFGLTLPHAPYAAFQSKTPEMKINVIGRMWFWEMKVEGGTEPGPLVIPLGKTVEFAVTSTDVNHAFGIYGPEGSIVTQTQAMPGYVNRLIHTFDKPGEYHVLCLEYCGTIHHAMLSKFTVR